MCPPSKSAKDLRASIEAEKKMKQEFLLKIIETAEGRTMKAVGYYEVGKTLGLSLSTSAQLQNYWCDQGMLRGNADPIVYLTDDCLEWFTRHSEEPNVPEKPRRRVKQDHPEPVFAAIKELKWNEVEIDFVNAGSLRIRARGKDQKFDFTEMGFKDDRFGRPNLQWKMLQELASANGMLQWPERQTRASYRKRKGELSGSLKAFFGILEEPLPWNEAEKAWIAKFHIRPEPGKSEFSPPRRIQPEDSE